MLLIVSVEKNHIQFKQNDYQNLAENFWTKNSSEVMAWQLTEHQTTSLINRCKEEGVTVNTIIVTLFLLALGKIEEKSISERSVHIPINIRSRLKVPAGEAFGFYAQAFILNLQNDHAESFWELARKYNQAIHSVIQDKKSIFNLFTVSKLDPDLLDSKYYTKYGMFSNKWSTFLTKQMGINDLIADLSITNIGKLDFPVKVGEFSIEALYGPSVYSDVLNCIVGVTTLGSKMNIIITFNEKLISKEKVLKEMSKNIKTLKHENIKTKDVETRRGASLQNKHNSIIYLIQSYNSLYFNIRLSLL